MKVTYLAINLISMLLFTFAENTENGRIRLEAQLEQLDSAMKSMLEIIQTQSLKIQQLESSSSQPECGYGNWMYFPASRQCFTFIDRVVTYRDALQICKSELGVPAGIESQILEINSSQEQTFLIERILKNPAAQNLQNNVTIWLGAQRRSNPNLNGSVFAWSTNGSTMLFTNWAADSPANNSALGCAVLNFPKSALGGAGTATASSRATWKAVPCGDRNLVVCQKSSTPNLAELYQNLTTELKISSQKSAAEIAKAQTDILDANSAISNLKSETDTARSSQANEFRSSLSKISSEFRNRVEDVYTLVRRNIIPPGFIYIQLPHQAEPKRFWSHVSWRDVTSQYAGYFFRAFGDESAAFGTAQEDNTRRLKSVRMSKSGRPNSNIQNDSTILPDVGVSPYVYSGDLFYQFDVAKMYFTLSTGEVRPKNMAVKIWLSV